MDPQELAGFHVGLWLETHSTSIAFFGALVTGVFARISGSFQKSSDLVMPLLIAIVVTRNILSDGLANPIWWSVATQLFFVCPAVIWLFNILQKGTLSGLVPSLLLVNLLGQWIIDESKWNQVSGLN